MVVIDTNNQIYATGHVKNGIDKNRLTHLPLPNEAVMEIFSIGRYSMIVMGTDQKFYWWGKNKYKHFQDSDVSYDRFTALANECAPKLSSGKIIQMASGSHFTLFVSDTGKLFARGKFFLDSIVLPILPTATLVPLQDNYQVKRVWATPGPKAFSVAFVEVVDLANKKQKKILSAGKSRFGVLGQGIDVKESNIFKEVKFNRGLSSVVDIQLASKSAFAITRDGKILAWGMNDSQQLGLPKIKENIYFEPTLIDFLSKYIIKKVAAGDSHTLVYGKKATKSGKESDTSCVFSIAKYSSDSQHYLGLTEEEGKAIKKDSFDPVLLKRFDDCGVKGMAAGFKSSFVFTDAPKEIA